MRTTHAALLCLCLGAAPAFAEEAREDKREESVQSAGKRSGAEESGAIEPNKEQSEERNQERSQVEQPVDAPNAQTLGRDQSGVYVNAPATNSAYSPSFVMRGFPAGVTLFDGASHGFTAQDVDLSTVDHVEFYKGPSAMLFGKALGGYGAPPITSARRRSRSVSPAPWPPRPASTSRGSPPISTRRSMTTRACCFA